MQLWGLSSSIMSQFHGRIMISGLSHTLPTKSSFFPIVSEFVSLVVGTFTPNGMRRLSSRRRATLSTWAFGNLVLFSDWSAQLVIAGNNRVCHDFTDLDRVTVRDAYSVTPMSVILNKMSGKGLISILIWDADRGYYIPDCHGP